MSLSSDDVNYLNSVGNTILYYPVLATLPIGLVGNLFGLFIYIRPNLNKKTNTGFLYACLCVLNLVFMLHFVLVFQSGWLFGYTVRMPCGLSMFLFRSSLCLVPWTQVIISFDRFISVVYPRKVSIMSKKVI